MQKVKSAKNADGEQDLEDEEIGGFAKVNFSKPGQSQSARVKTTESVAGCLFSDIESESFEQNLEQMFKKYGFSIIEEKSCIDRQALISHLANRIHKEHSCIHCGRIRIIVFLTLQAKLSVLPPQHKCI